MAGHSRWANIRHKKAKSDARRGKIWSKCVRQIMVAARLGGPDPAANLTLRFAVDEAKAANVPKDTIERAIKKATGELQAEQYEAVRYEGYGPGGVAVIVDALTDNRTRTAPEMRQIFTKYGGNLGATGCVAYLFEQKGVIVIEQSAVDEEKLMTIALEAGAEDVSADEGLWTVSTAPADYLGVKDAIARAGIEPVSAELTMVPSTYVMLTGELLQRTVKLIEALEDNDDVQKVYTNMDASTADLAAAAG